MMKRLILLVISVVSLSAMAQQSQTIQWRIEGMHCDHCAHKVMTALTQDKGVNDVDINIERRVATVTYDASKTTPEKIKSQLNGTRYVPTTYSTSDVISREKAYLISDMHCANCARRISNALEQIAGVDSMDFDVSKHTFSVKYDANKTSRDIIRTTITQLGYTPVTYYDQDIVAYLYFILPEGSVSEDIAEKVMEIEGVADANISMKNNSLAISYDTTEITDGKLIEELKSRDIKVEIPKPHECQEK